MLCYLVDPVGIERNMPPDLRNSRKRILIRPHAIDRLPSSSGNAVVIAIAFPRVAMIVSIVETCRRLNISLRDYLASVLPGLADRPISQTADLTPAAWAKRNASAPPPSSAV